MAFTLPKSLRDREYDQFFAADTGSRVVIGMQLFALQSGTTTLVPVLCNSAGMLLTSGL